MSKVPQELVRTSTDNLPADWRKKALKNLSALQGQIVLIKVGGELLDSPELAQGFADDIVELKQSGIFPIVCHGGGPQLTRLMEKVGKSPVFVEGHRVTDAETLELTAMVFLGSLNRKLVGLINRNSSHAVGLSGVDARLLSVEPKGSQFGLVGNVTSVNCDFLQLLLKQQYIPVIAPLGLSKDGATLNINADAVAGTVAQAMNASQMALVTNVAGIYPDFEDQNSLLESVTTAELEDLLQHGSVEGGMVPKIESLLTAVRGGVKKAFLVDGRKQHALMLAIGNLGSAGTSVTLS